MKTLQFAAFVFIVFSAYGGLRHVVKNPTQQHYVEEMEELRAKLAPARFIQTRWLDGRVILPDASDYA